MGVAIEPTAADWKPEPGWSELNALKPGQGLKTFVSGDPRSNLLRVQYFRRDADNALVGHAWFGPQVEGPPGHAHGGSMAAVLDEAMGGAAWLAGHPVVAAQITTRFRTMLPLGTMVRLEAWVESVNGRKVQTRARLFGAGSTPFAEGEGLFIKLDPEVFKDLSDDVLNVLRQIRDDSEAADA